MNLIETDMLNVREPSVSGMFYPDNPGVLKREVASYLENADVGPCSCDVYGMISPHAGYVYSGQVAAYAYKAVSRQRFDTVIVIAPSHRSYFEGVAVWGRGCFRTPLGEIGIDETTADELIGSCDVIASNENVHRPEHSLEVQLPFLQCVFDDFMLVPLLMGAQDETLYERTATSLEKVIRGSSKRFLIVGSTDLSHYHPYETAVKIDNVAVDHLKDFDVRGMIKDTMSEKAQACGAGPMITTMMTSKRLGADQSKVLNYANSGDVSGDRSAVVGYVSAIFFKGQ